MDAEFIRLNKTKIPCVLEMAILLTNSKSNYKRLYSFYNHRICIKYNKIEQKYKDSFEFCQMRIHGKQRPNYESESQMSRRNVHDKNDKRKIQII